MCTIFSVFNSQLGLRLNPSTDQTLGDNLLGSSNNGMVTDSGCTAGFTQTSSRVGSRTDHFDAGFSTEYADWWRPHAFLRSLWIFAGGNPRSAIEEPTSNGRIVAPCILDETLSQAMCRKLRNSWRQLIDRDEFGALKA